MERIELVIPRTNFDITDESFDKALDEFVMKFFNPETGVPASYIPFECFETLEGRNSVLYKPLTFNSSVDISRLCLTCIENCILGVEITGIGKVINFESLEINNKNTFGHITKYKYFAELSLVKAIHYTENESNGRKIGLINSSSIFLPRLLINSNEEIVKILAIDLILHVSPDELLVLKGKNRKDG